jgi:hypothetical protein
MEEKTKEVRGEGTIFLRMSDTAQAIQENTKKDLCRRNILVKEKRMILVLHVLFGLQRPKKG